MSGNLGDVCTTFINNRDIIKTTFKWENNYMFPVCSAIFIGKNVTPNKDVLIKCNQLLKENTTFFSNFNGILKIAIISTIATYSDPEVKLKQSLRIYDILRKDFKTSPYLILTSIMLTDLQLTDTEYFNVSKKAKEIYKLLKNNHPLLTSHEDITFCILSALSNRSATKTSELAQECYVLLKPHFSSANAVHSLSHILSVYDDSSQTKVTKVLSLYKALKEKGYKCGKGYELTSLGLLAMLPLDIDDIISDLISVDKFLSQQKGYGLFGFAKSSKLIHASMIICSYYLQESASNNIHLAATNSLLSLILAQQSCVMISCITASSAASSSTS